MDCRSMAQILSIHLLIFLIILHKSLNLAQLACFFMYTYAHRSMKNKPTMTFNYISKTSVSLLFVCVASATHTVGPNNFYLLFYPLIY